MKTNILVTKIFAFLIAVLAVFSVAEAYTESGILLEGIRVTEKEEEEERDVDFNLSNISYEIEDRKADIYGVDIDTDLDVKEVLYSLDGGLSWEEAEGLEFDLSDEEMFSDKLILNFKVITQDDESFKSVDKYIVDEAREDNILGYFFRNKGEPIVTNNDGDILFNPNHELEVFVETGHSTSQVKVGFGDDFSDLNYDYTTQLWYGTVSEEVLGEEVNSLEVVAGGVSQDLPDVLNVKYLDENENSMYVGYDIYYFNGYEWRVLNYSDEKLDYSIFNIVPGKYYVRVNQGGRDLYSSIFEVEERTIVSFSSAEDSFSPLFSWLEKYFMSLETEFFDSSYGGEDVYSTYEVADFADLEEFIEGEEDAIFLYINAWNPLYKNYLARLEHYVGDKDVILFTDSKNYPLLASGIEKYNESMELYEVDTEILDLLREKQTKVFFYDSSDNSIFGFNGTDLLRNLDKFINEGF